MAALLALAGTAAAPAHGAPVVEQMVVFRDGEAKSRAVGTDATRVSAGGRRCRVPRATPLAALLRSRVAALRVRDFSGSCDPSSLFVRSIGGEKNRGQRGWVYKVGHRQGTTSASDPSGPFGSGRLRRGARITWFYCVFAEGGCQRTLGLRVKAVDGGSVTVRVTGHDDEGRGSPVAGALVRSGDAAAETDAAGRATLSLPPGTHRLHAQKRGAIRSFTERVEVR